MLRKSSRIAAKAKNGKEKEAETTATVIATGTSAASPKILKTLSPKTKKTNKKKELMQEMASVQALQDEEKAKQAKEEAMRQDVSHLKRGYASCKNAIKILFSISRDEKREREKLEHAVKKNTEDLSSTIADQGRRDVVTNNMVEIQQATLLTVRQILCAFAVFTYVAFFIGMKVMDAFGDDAFVTFNIVTAVGFVGAVVYAAVMAVWHVIGRVYKSITKKD